jgi:hypothetical protein
MLCTLHHPFRDANIRCRIPYARSLKRAFFEQCQLHHIDVIAGRETVKFEYHFFPVFREYYADRPIEGLIRYLPPVASWLRTIDFPQFINLLDDLAL